MFAKTHDSLLLSCRLSKGLYKTKNTEPGLVTMGFELCTQCTFRKESSLDKLHRLIKGQPVVHVELKAPARVHVKASSRRQIGLDGFFPL